MGCKGWRQGGYIDQVKGGTEGEEEEYRREKNEVKEDEERKKG